MAIILRFEGQVEVGHCLENDAKEKSVGEVRISSVAGDEPHGLDGVGKDRFLIRFSFGIIITAVMHESHLL